MSKCNFQVDDADINLLYTAMKRFSEEVSPNSGYYGKVEPMIERLLIARGQVRYATLGGASLNNSHAMPP